MYIKDFKIVDGVTLYSFSETLFPGQVIMFEEGKFSTLYTQHGDYFELEDLGKPFVEKASSDIIVVSGGASGMTNKIYLQAISELLILDYEMTVVVDSMWQSVKIKCKDKFWEELFKTVDERVSNSKIPALEYNSFVSNKYGKVIRIH